VTVATAAAIAQRCMLFAVRCSWTVDGEPVHRRTAPRRSAPSITGHTCDTSCHIEAVVCCTVHKLPTSLLCLQPCSRTLKAALNEPSF